MAKRDKHLEAIGDIQELLRFFGVRHLEQMLEVMDPALQELTARIEREVVIMQQRGMSPVNIRQVLATDLADGGRIFGPAMKTIQNDVRSQLEAVEQQIADHELKLRPVKVIRDRRGNVLDIETESTNPDARWLCALLNTCEDCLPRHGEVDTMDSWGERGLPRSGWSICKQHCKCQLIPLSMLSTSETNEPLKLAEAGARMKMAEIDRIADAGGPNTAAEAAAYKVFGSANHPDTQRMIDAFFRK